MENAVYLALSRQMALRNNMNIVANNVANMSTPGYRGQNLIFSEEVEKPRNADDSLSFVIDRGQYQVTTAGPLSTTNNPFDVALEGPGFFGMQYRDGEIAYTRAGNFTVGTDGTLMNAAGIKVADAGGGDIVIPAGSTEISIDERGFVSNQNGQIGQIMVVEFDNVQTLNPLGNTLYSLGPNEDGTLPDPKDDVEDTRVFQGVLEGSNVKPIIEMTRMIDILRSHQSVERALQGENERLRNAIRTLTQRN